MKKFLALVAFATLSFNAAAHGPTPQKSDNRITIKADPAKVWAIVKDFGGIQKWTPSVEKVSVQKKGKTTVRELTLKSGKVVTEKLTSLDDNGMKIKYAIVQGAPVSNHSAWLKVYKGKNAGESEVRQFIRFYRFYPQNPPIPAGQDDESAVEFVKETYEPSLQALKELVEGSK